MKKSLFAMLVLVWMPAAALAQSHWGAEFSFTPTWKAKNDVLETFYGLQVGDTTIKGTEFTIGFVRGSMRGGEWGLSYFRKPFEDFTTVESESGCQTFGGATSCDSTVTTLVGQNVAVKGVEAHWFIPFAIIKDRFQVGMNVAVGGGQPEGTFTETRAFTSTFTAPNQKPQTINQTDTYDVPANEVMYKWVPQFKLEAQGAIIVAPGLKIKISGGLNAPSQAAFRIGAIYLIGAE